MSSNHGISLHSKSLSRAVSFNKEQERRLSLEEAGLSDCRHRIRCNINSKMYQLRADMYRVQVKTPSLEECFEGKTLCGLDPNESKAQAQVSSYYEINGNGRLVKKTPARKATSAKTRRTPSRKAVTIPSTAEMQGKISSFFDRNRELFTPANEQESEWANGMRSRSQSFFREIEPSGQDGNRPRTAAFVTRMTQGKETGTPKSSTKATATNETSSDSLHDARKGAATSGNPYQSFFKPEASTLRFAQQMVVVSRKLKTIQVKREEKIQEMNREKIRVAERLKIKEDKKLKRHGSAFRHEIDLDTDDDSDE